MNSAINFSSPELSFYCIAIIVFFLLAMRKQLHFPKVYGNKSPHHHAIKPTHSSKILALILTHHTTKRGWAKTSQ